MPPATIAPRTARMATSLLVAGALAGCAGGWYGSPVQSSVHEIGGRRVDVPQRDLASDGSGLLRNGLMPQPQEFD